MRLKTELIQEFLESKDRENLSPLTISRHADNLRYFRAYMRRKELSRKNNNKFIDSYRKGRSPATVNSAISTIKCFYRFLDENDIFPNVFHFYLKSMKERSTPPVLLSIDQVNAIIECPRTWGEHHKWMDRRKYDFFFEFIGRCGLRRIEALKLRVSDIDFEKKTYRVQSKGGNIDVLPLPQIMIGRLQIWLFQRKAKPAEFVFRSKNGKMASPQMFSDELKKRLDILGYDKSVHLHTFRHTFVTEMRRAKMDLIKSMRVTRHTSVETHMRYTHFIPDDLREIVDEHPVNRIVPEDRWIEDEPLGIPYILKPKERQVN